MENAIIICSGGLDSVVTAHYVKKRLDYSDLIILFFNYAQKSILKEREFSKKCAKDLGAKFIEIDLKWLGKISSSLINKPGKTKKIALENLKNTKKESEKYYVPCRNLIFLNYALALAESLQIQNKKSYNLFTGFKNEGKEHYPDTTQEFVKDFNQIISTMKIKKIKLFAPLIKQDKEDIILLGDRLGINFKKTYSCYTGKKIHCGSCLACKLRQAGFYWANLKDPTDYLE